MRDVLNDALEEGGTTLRNYVDGDGNPGYFRQSLNVYERAGDAVQALRHADQAPRSGTTRDVLLPALPEIGSRGASALATLSGRAAVPRAVSRS